MIGRYVLTGICLLILETHRGLDSNQGVWAHIVSCYSKHINILNNHYEPLEKQTNTYGLSFSRRSLALCAI